MSTIMSQFLWFNKSIMIDNNSAHFSNNCINYVVQLFKTNRKIKTWDDIMTEFNLENKRCFSWMQHINGLP